MRGGIITSRANALIRRARAVRAGKARELIFIEGVRLCEEAVREETGDAPRLPSGPLHDAAEMVPHMPVVMMFAYSARGLSHCKEEDTPGPHLETTIRAYLRLVQKTIQHVSASDF